MLAALILDKQAEADTSVRVAAARALVQIEHLPDVFPGHSLSGDQRQQILSLLRQVGSEATDARHALEASWREDHNLEASTADTPSPADADTSDSAGVTPDRLAAVESGIADLHKLIKSQQGGLVEKEWYTVIEVAELTSLNPWTIRDACNKGRIVAEKGPDKKWRISKSTLVAIQNRGLPKETDAE